MIRKAKAVWQGAGRDGTGALTTDSGGASYSDTQANFGDTAYVVIAPQADGLAFSSSSGYAYPTVTEPVPEPASLGILAAGLPLLLRRRRY